MFAAFHVCDIAGHPALMVVVWIQNASKLIEVYLITFLLGSCIDT